MNSCPWIAIDDVTWWCSKCGCLSIDDVDMGELVDIPEEKTSNCPDVKVEE
jgi:hypothetical protein